MVCKFSGLTRMEKGKIVLVKKNLDYLEAGHRESLFRILYLNVTEVLSWAAFDGYPDIPVGQYGVNFTIFLLLKYGNAVRSTDFYAEKYLNGYPNFKLECEYLIGNNDLEHCYALRSFDRFTNWFGFTEFKEIKYDEKEIVASDVLRKIFKLDV